MMQTTSVTPYSASPAQREGTIRTIDIVSIVLLVALCVVVRVAMLPPPGAWTVAQLTQPRAFPPTYPPSYDEVLNLVMSTGRDDVIKSLPRDTLIRNLSDPTSLDGALPWWQVWSHYTSVSYPPLYVVSLRLWREAFGAGDRVAIAHTIFWSCVALVLTYLVAAHSFGRAAAVVCGLGTAVLLTHHYFGTEIRAYSMLAALATLVLYALVRIHLDGATWTNVGLLALGLLSTMLTHYFAFPVCLAVGIAALCWAGPGRRRRVVGMGLACMVVYAAIWLPFAIRQLQGVRPWEVTFLDRPDRTVFQELMLGAAMPLRFLVEYTPVWNFWWLGAVMFVAPIVLARRHPSLRPVVIPYAAVVCFLLALDIARGTGHIDYIRYAATGASSMLIALVGSAVVLSKRSIAGVVISAAGIVLLAMLGAQPRVLNDAPETWVRARALASAIRPDETLVVVDAHPQHDEMTMIAFVQEIMRIPGVAPRDLILTHRPLSADLLAQVRTSHLRVAVLSTDRPPAELVPGAMPESAVWFPAEYPPKPPHLIAFRCPVPSPTTAPAGGR